MKNFGLYLVIFVLFFSGCAVMNTSMMETAETSKPGHPKFGVEYGYGLDLTSTMLITSINEETNFDATSLLSLPVYGMKAGIGLTDRMDLNGKVWVSFGGVGSKVYLKYGIPHKDEKLSMAVMPGLTYVTTESEEDDFIELAEIKSYGIELPFLVTYRVGKAFSCTGMVRYSADVIKIEEGDRNYLAFMLNRFGLIGGLSLDLGPFYFRPEFGLEMATPKYGTFGVAPIFAIGTGLEF